MVFGSYLKLPNHGSVWSLSYPTYEKSQAADWFLCCIATKTCLFLLLISTTLPLIISQYVRINDKGKGEGEIFC